MNPDFVDLRFQSFVLTRLRELGPDQHQPVGHRQGHRALEDLQRHGRQQGKKQTWSKIYKD